MTLEQRDQELKLLYFKFKKQENRLKNIIIFLGKHPFKRVKRSIEKSVQVVKITSRLAMLRNQAALIASTPMPNYPEGGIRHEPGYNSKGEMVEISIVGGVPKVVHEMLPMGLGKGESVINTKKTLK